MLRLRLTTNHQNLACFSRNLEFPDIRKVSGKSEFGNVSVSKLGIIELIDYEKILYTDPEFEVKHEFE